MYILARELRKASTETNLKAPDIYLGRLWDNIQSHRDWIEFLKVLNSKG